MQTMRTVVRGAIHSLDLPAAHECVVPGVSWGRFDDVGTPAFWRGQSWQHELIGTYEDLRLGRSLTEEVAACLLGGFGMPAELGLMAYSRLRERELLIGCHSAQVLEAALSEPFDCSGRFRRYRFARQKANYLAGCLRRLADLEEPDDDLDLRNALTDFPGVGLKTASWVVRNYRRSDAVAIIDIHILRAGRQMNLFKQEWNPQRDYHALEAKFLTFATAIGAPASSLDGMMWDYARRMPS